MSVPSEGWAVSLREQLRHALVGSREYNQDIGQVKIGSSIVSNGRVQTTDEDTLITQASQAATAAWNRFSQRYGSYVAPAPN